MTKQTQRRTGRAAAMQDGQSRPHPLADRYQSVRARTQHLCEPLAVEDYVVQTMPDVSPTRWHLAHTTWFFETFVLEPFESGFQLYQPEYRYLFNSYYNQVGAQFERPARGTLSRPTVEEVMAYRSDIDRRVLALLEQSANVDAARIASMTTVGLHHEQQHQELMLTDIKHVFWSNPLRPVYQESRDHATDGPGRFQWISHEGGKDWIGHGRDGFAFDNEMPRHCVYVHPFGIASRLVTNEEYLAFMEDGGYDRPEFWLSDGWETVQANAWRSPLYWEQRDGAWWVMTLGGMKELDLSEPVCHVSFYEADAFARWAGARLLTEAEWEIASQSCPVEGHFAEDDRFHPASAPPSAGRPVQMFGDVWEWTASPYVRYPGYEPPPGALGEYNEKFMCNQMVLRGGSCVTPRSHIRRTYRNFFPPDARWQFAGIRLGKDA